MKTEPANHDNALPSEAYGDCEKLKQMIKNGKYTLDCGHQAVELLRQDLESAPFWVVEGDVDHLAARDARSLCRLLLGAANLDEAYGLIESARDNLATHPDEMEEDDEEDDEDAEDR